MNKVRKMQTAAGGPIKRQKDGYRYIPDGNGGWTRISDNSMSDVFATYVVKGKDKRADVRIDKKSENFDRKFKYDETEIPFIKDKEITLTNAGLYTGAKLSTNLLDSIAKYAKISGLPLKTAVGLVAKETSLGNPTVDSSLKKLAGDDFAYQLAKALNGGLHINEGKALNPKDLINFHYEELNPYLGLKNIAYKKSVGNMGDYGREGPFGDEDFLKRYRELLKLGENYSDNLAKKLLSNFNPNKNVLQAGFEFYKLNPRKYNYNQTNYPLLVEERGNMVYNSPEFKSWLSTSEYKKQGGKMNVLEFLKNGSGIHIKKKNRGKFTEFCGGKVTLECINRGKRSSNPITRKRATFADNARHFKHKSGGKAFYNGVSILDSDKNAYKRVKKKYRMHQYGGPLQNAYSGVYRDVLIGRLYDLETEELRRLIKELQRLADLLLQLQKLNTISNILGTAINIGTNYLSTLGNKNGTPSNTSTINQPNSISTPTWNTSLKQFDFRPSTLALKSMLYSNDPNSFFSLK